MSEKPQDNAPEEYDVAPAPPPPPRREPPPKPLIEPPDDSADDSADEEPARPKLSERDERNVGMLCHLLGVCGFVIPFGNIIGPLVVWLMKRDQSEFVEHQGKEAVNWQITMTIASVVLTVAHYFMQFTFLPMLGPYYVVAIVNVIFIVQAAIASHKGTRYQYPASLRLIA